MKSVWQAMFTTPNTENYALGATPEDAVEAMIRHWQEMARFHGGDPAYVSECRADMRVVEMELGKGYGLGTTDRFWPDNALSGDDPLFADVFRKFYPDPGRRRGY